MAIPFKSPTPKHSYRLASEKAAITRHFNHRQVPSSRDGRLLLASWNIANLGAQSRTPNAINLIAHIMRRFDLIAVQEVNNKHKAFQRMVSAMGSGFDYIMTDPAGNNERLAFVFRKNKVSPSNLFGELALRPREYPKRTVKVRWTGANKVPRIDTFSQLRYVPFDRNPFIGSFSTRKLNFVLVNVHLYFGSFQNSKKKAERAKYARRVLEIYALSRWADRRHESGTAYDKDVILMGDMNVPAMDEEESTYKALKQFGWKPVDYTSKTGGSNLGNDKTYDQMLFAPGAMRNRILDKGVFDFDKTVFRPLWNRLSRDLSNARAIGLFNRHVKHHISDHRPLWVELDTN